MCGLQETQPIHLGLPGRLREKPDIPLPFLPPLPLSLPSPSLSLPVKVGPLNTARGPGGAVSSPSLVWSRAAAEIAFGAF